MRILNFISCVCLATGLVACSFLHDDQVVARVNGKKLYKSEVVKYIPHGLAVPDSLALASQYVNAWAAELIMNDRADKLLSKKEKDVRKELDDYRNSLLKYRFEQHYIENHLDTVVTMEQIEAHFKANPDLYVSVVPVLKARYLELSAVSPVKEQMKGLLSSEDVDDLALLDSLSYSHAEQFTLFDGKWIDMVDLAREFGMDYGSLMRSMSGNWIDVVDNQGVEHIAFIEKFIPGGRVPPMEFCIDKIRESILNQRKYSLSSTLEQNLLDEALSNGNFVIYENELEN